jgi:hypothetical protein
MMVRREKSNQYAFLKMELSTKESGLWTRTKRTAAEFKFGPMDPGMTASGETVWLMAMADLSTLKEMSMRESGLRIKQMDMESTLTSMEVGTRANGFRISSMDSV